MKSSMSPYLGTLQRRSWTKIKPNKNQKTTFFFNVLFFIWLHSLFKEPEKKKKRLLRNWKVLLWRIPRFACYWVQPCLKYILFSNRFRRFPTSTLCTKSTMWSVMYRTNKGFHLLANKNVSDCWDLLLNGRREREREWSNLVRKSMH